MARGLDLFTTHTWHRHCSLQAPRKNIKRWPQLRLAGNQPLHDIRVTYPWYNVNFNVMLKNVCPHRKVRLRFHLYKYSNTTSILILTKQDECGWIMSREKIGRSQKNVIVESHNIFYLLIFIQRVYRYSVISGITNVHTCLCKDWKTTSFCQSHAPMDKVVCCREQSVCVRNLR
jgi:hypothetical protein